jgi:hypothetical protein
MINIVNQVKVPTKQSNLLQIVNFNVNLKY